MFVFACLRVSVFGFLCFRLCFYVCVFVFFLCLCLCFCGFMFLFCVPVFLCFCVFVFPRFSRVLVFVGFVFV